MSFASFHNVYIHCVNTLPISQFLQHLYFDFAGSCSLNSSSFVPLTALKLRPQLRSFPYERNEKYSIVESCSETIVALYFRPQYSTMGTRNRLLVANLCPAYVQLRRDSQISDCFMRCHSVRVRSELLSNRRLIN